MHDEHGKIINWFGTCTDIEDIRRAKEELQAAEAKFKGLVETAPDPFVIVNASGMIEGVNRQTEKNFGYDRSELIGKPIETLIPARYRGRHVIERNGFVATPRTRPMGAGLELFALRKDGTEFPVEISLSPLETSRGLLVTSIIRDISEKKENERTLVELNRSLERRVLERTEQLSKEIQWRMKTEDELRRHAEAIERSESKFKVLAEAIPQLCWIARADGFIFWYNQRWYKFTGTTPKEMEGWGWQSVQDPKLLPGVMDRWQRSIRTGEPFEMEFPLRAADGRFRWFLTRVLPLRDSEKKITNWFGTNTDIDDQKRVLIEREDLVKAVKAANEQLEKRVQDRTRELVRSNKELEQFAYIASHDLQTPLRHITSYVQLLVAKIKRTTNLDPQSEKWVKYIVAGTQQMKTLINDLLSYSRVGRVDNETDEVGITKVIAEVSDILRESIRRTHAKIIYENLPVVFGVRSQLIQLFQNLIENSLKFRKPEVSPSVEIRFEEQGEFWKFFVSDNGIGIDPKYSERIFTMFQRLHAGAEYEGTGIGLAICKKIVEFHGGKIGVDSAEGKGATFYFNLPKKERKTLASSEHSQETERKEEMAPLKRTGSE